LVPASGAFAQQAPQEVGLGIRLVDAPVALKDDPRAGIFIIDRVQAGTTITRRVEVSNGTSKPLTPNLRVAAASIRRGAFVVEQPSVRNEITRWGQISPTSLSLAPGQRAQAKVTIEVPKGAPDGEYYGAAVASDVPRDGGTGVAVAAGVGVRIYLSVGKGAVNSDFELKKLTASRLADGRPLVTSSVRNTGERALDMSGDLKLSNGPGGVKGGPFPAEVGTTLGIGDTEDVRVILDKDTPAGPWDAVLTLRSGTIKRAVKARITFPEVGAGPKDIEFDDLQKKRTFGALASSLIILLLAIMAIVAWRLRRARAREAAD
jgi:hypothetical protein